MFEKYGSVTPSDLPLIILEISPTLLLYKIHMYWNKCIFMIDYLYIVGLGLFGLITILYFVIK